MGHVFAASQTLGSTANPGDVQLVVDDLGAVRFRSNDSGVIHDQWLFTGTDPSNGVIIGFNDGNAKKFRSRFFTAGAFVTPVSNISSGTTVTTVYRLGNTATDPVVTQFVALDTNNRLYDISWTIEVPSGGTNITSLQLIHGGDTNLLGDDFGSGSWKATTRTVSVHPDLAVGSGSLSLDGVTPPTAYDAVTYTQLRNNGNSLTLTNSVSASIVDIGMAMQWNIGSLSAGNSVTIRSTVSLSTTSATATPTPAAGTPSATPTHTRTPTPIATETGTPTGSPTPTWTATQSPTPSVAPSSTPTVTPTATETGGVAPTATFTLTPTDTPTFTPTETHTGTATATPTTTPSGTPSFNSTPDPGIGSIQPPIFDPPAGGVTRYSRPILTGIAPTGAWVRIFIDGVHVGDTAVKDDGTFSFQVPAPLAVGEHEVKGKTIVSDGGESSFSLAIIVTIRRDAVLDFDADGLTDVTGHSVRGNRIVFRAVLSSSQRVISESVEGWFPAPADYDGDGAWDYGGVGVSNGALRWSITLSGSGATRGVSFGTSGDIVLAGCRFGDDGHSTLAVMRGRHIRFRTLHGSSRGAFSVEASDLRQVIGCGDVDGDGVDELILSNRETRKVDRVTAVTRVGTRREVSNVSKFINGFIAREWTSGAPVLGALRGSGRDRKSSELRALRGTFEFPVVQLPSSLDVASGTFMRSDRASLTSGITWQSRGTLDVLRLLANEKDPTKVLKLSKGYRVTKPQDSRRVAGSRVRR